MRTRSGPLIAAHAGPVQDPSWLVEITLDATTLRLCSAGTVTWNSQTWTAADLRVENLKVGALKISGTLVLGNADDAYGAILLTEGFRDKRIRIWHYEATITSPAADDVLPACDAVGAGADVGTDVVRVGLRDPSELMVAPRAVVTPGFGFNTLLPAGSILTINGQSYTLERR